MVNFEDIFGLSFGSGVAARPYLVKSCRKRKIFQENGEMSTITLRTTKEKVKSRKPSFRGLLDLIYRTCFSQ